MANLTTLIISGVFALLFIGFALYLLKAIGANLASGRAYRRSLEAQAQAEPLGDMIQSMGLPINNYLHHESVLNIRHQLHQCRECRATDECRDWLSHDRRDGPPVFCPNGERLAASRARLNGTA